MGRWERRGGEAYDALVLHRDDAISNPEPPASHHVGHHDVSGESVPDDGYMRWVGGAGLGVGLEVVHDLGPATWLLGTVRKDGYPSAGLYLCSELQLTVIGRCPSSVGHDQQAATRVGRPEVLEVLLKIRC